MPGAYSRDNSIAHVLSICADSTDLPAEDGPSAEDDFTRCNAEACAPHDHQVPGGR